MRYVAHVSQLESHESIGVINRRKAAETAPAQPPAPSTSARPRSNVYVNPNYKPPSKTARPPAPPPQPRPAARPPPTLPQEKRDVVLNGVEFESSGRALVRKDRKSSIATPLYTTAMLFCSRSSSCTRLDRCNLTLDVALDRERSRSLVARIAGSRIRRGVCNGRAALAVFHRRLPTTPTHAQLPDSTKAPSTASHRNHVEPDPTTGSTTILIQDQSRSYCEPKPCIQAQSIEARTAYEPQHDSQQHTQAIPVCFHPSIPCSCTIYQRLQVSQESQVF